MVERLPFVDYTEGGNGASNDFPVLKTLKFGEPIMKEKLFSPYGAVSMFTDEDIGNPLAFCILFVHFFSIDEHHHIGILFDSPRFAQISQHGNRRFSIFYGTTQLGKSNHRNIQFLG